MHSRRIALIVLCGLAVRCPVVVGQDRPNPPGPPRLVSVGDTESPGNSSTNDTTPTFAGTAAAGSTVNLYTDDRFLGSQQLDKSSDHWTIQSAHTLDVGQYKIIAKSSRNNLISDPSAPLMLTIVATPPEPPFAMELHPDADDGMSAADGITSQTMPIVTGVAQGNETVQLFLGKQLIGSTKADDDI